MNWVLVLVLMTMAAGMASGWRRGLLRMVFSLVSWAVVLIFVSWSAPYIKDYLMTQTSLYETIQRQCENTISRAAVGEEEIATIRDRESAGAEFAKLGIVLPEAVAEDILENITGAADSFLEESGIYGELSKGIACFVVEGIAYLTALTGAWLIVHLILQILGIVSHIPVINGLNRFLGIFVGGFYGLVLVWIVFYIAALCSASGPGAAVIENIRRNLFLTFLYEKNLFLLLFLRRF